MSRHIHEGQMIHSSLLHDKPKDSHTIQSVWDRFVSIFYQTESAPYRPKASMKLVNQDENQGWNVFYKPVKPESSSLPSFVERDLYDLALELANALRSIVPFHTHYLLRQFISLASSGES